jgi:hypothetical protein
MAQMTTLTTRLVSLSTYLPKHCLPFPPFPLLTPQSPPSPRLAAAVQKNPVKYSSAETLLPAEKRRKLCTQLGTTLNKTKEGVADIIISDEDSDLALLREADVTDTAAQQQPSKPLKPGSSKKPTAAASIVASRAAATAAALGKVDSFEETLASSDVAMGSYIRPQPTAKPPRPMLDDKSRRLLEATKQQLDYLKNAARREESQGNEEISIDDDEFSPIHLRNGAVYKNKTQQEAEKEKEKEKGKNERKRGGGGDSETESESSLDSDDYDDEDEDGVGDGDGDGGREIQLKLRCKPGTILLKVAYQEGFNKMFDDFKEEAKKKGWLTGDETLKFVFDGDVLAGKVTAEGLDLDGDEVIEVQWK